MPLSKLQARRRIVLASSSPYRRELLERFRLPFTVAAPYIDETPRAAEAPIDLVLRLTEEKVRAVARAETGDIFIASDQVAVCEGRIVGKPGNRTVAAQQLAQQSGRSVVFLTGIAVFEPDKSELQLDHVTCSVTFRTLSEIQISHYLDADQPYNCAGSFKSESLGIALLARMECPDPTALIGLPLIRLAAMLAQANVDVIGASLSQTDTA